MGSNVVSVGTRHVKVWRLEQSSSPAKARRGLDGMSDGPNASPVPRTFNGRNCLLGSLQDAVFTCVVGISEDMAVVCTQDGSICLLDDTERSQRLHEVTKKKYTITCITLDRSSGVIWIGGKGVEPEAMPLDAFLTAKHPLAAPGKPCVTDESINLSKTGKLDIIAICCVDGRLIAVSNDRDTSIYDVVHANDAVPTASLIQQLPAHDSAVQGVIILPRPNECQSDFLTYSEKGHVLYWLWNGKCRRNYFVQLDQPLALGTEQSNSLRTVRMVPGHETILAGDKAGTLQYVSSHLKHT